jgi:hypothetical protein
MLAIEELWDALIDAHERVRTGPMSDRREIAAYRNGLLAAYAIITGESESKVRVRLMENEVER